MKNPINKRGSYLQGEYKPIHPEKYKGKVPILWRSSWELRLMKFFDLNDNVVEWTSESLMVNYYNPIDARNHRYFPDFTVIYRNNNNELVKEIIEVKPKKETKPPVAGKRGQNQRYFAEMATHIKNINKWEAVKHVAEKMGYSFRIITEDDLFGK